MRFEMTAPVTRISGVRKHQVCVGPHSVRSSHDSAWPTATHGDICVLGADRVRAMGRPDAVDRYGITACGRLHGTLLVSSS